jgi:hypothetical protein
LNSYGHCDEVQFATTDYGVNTDLNTNYYYCGSYCTGNTIVHYADAWYDKSWAALAYPYSYGVPCADTDGVPTGYCNETDHKVDFSYVIWNSTKMPTTDASANYLGRHEMGHVFGLAHNCSNAYTSVMRGGLCLMEKFGSLQAHDISDINAKY